MTLIELQQLCNSGDDSPETFAKIVSEYINLEFPVRYLANEFEVADSTVARWANGVAKPLPRMQKMIIQSIQNLIVKALNAKA